MRRTYYPSNLPKPPWAKVYENHAPTLKVEPKKEVELEDAPLHYWTTPAGIAINIWNILTGKYRKPL